MKTKIEKDLGMCDQKEREFMEELYRKYERHYPNHINRRGEKCSHIRSAGNAGRGPSLVNIKIFGCVFPNVESYIMSRAQIRLERNDD